MKNKNGIYSKSVIFIKMISESISFAFSQLRGDKFRTLLSLLGVSIGIFCIVSIFCAIDSLDKNVKEGLNTVSGDMIQISKWPMGPEDDGSEYKWWEYLKRPSSTYNEYKFLIENSKLSEAISFAIFVNTTAKKGRNSVSGTSLACVTPEFDKIVKINLDEGRFFNQEEDRMGTPVAVIGYEVAQKLFPGWDNIVGETIKISNYTVNIIGVFEKRGESIVNVFDTDQAIVIPLGFGKYIVNPLFADNQIMAIPKVDVLQDEFISEIKVLTRNARRLKPTDKDNFSIGTMSFVFNMVQSTFAILSTIGWIIAGFSLLIGGFGIANIMFVSVKERTNMIGVQKALGAKKYVILTQFLVESAFLALAGGFIGVLLVALIVLAVNASSDVVVSLSLVNVLSGFGIASVIGVIAGVLPAWSAANLNPVEAISAR